MNTLRLSSRIRPFLLGALLCGLTGCGLGTERNVGGECFSDPSSLAAEYYSRLDRMAQTGYREAETESVLQLSGREVGAAVRADLEYFRDSGLTQTGKTGVEIVDVEEFDGNFRILVSVDVSDISYTRGGQRVVSNVANPIFDATMEVRAVEGCLFVQDLKPRV